MPQDHLEIEIDFSDIEGWSEESAQKIDKATGDVAQFAFGEVLKEMPRKSGQMANMTGLTKKDTAHYQIKTDIFYAVFVHDGTGIYGERGVPITPRHAEFMRFEYNGRIIFAKSVKGQEPNPFYDRAKETTEEKMESIVDKVLQDL